MKAELSSLLASRGMSHVHLLGFQSGAAKSDLIRNARAVIVPSESDETFGLSVLEAYAAGRAVIASSAGALPGLVEDGVTGRIFERKSAEALRSRVLELDADPAAARRMGLEGWRRARHQYTPEAAFRSLIDTFEFVRHGPAIPSAARSGAA
jgi:glycosyltransferase involved in cell wall biosynthesis